MKKILSFATAILLAACGGDSEPAVESPSLFTAMQGSSEKVTSTTPGELRAYDLSWSQGVLTGIPIVSGLTSFQISGSEVRLQDISVSFDKDGLTGDLYRLYQAAFGRTPDVAGLGYWKEALEKEQINLGQIAMEFLRSSEAQKLFGSNTTDAQYIERLYLNVLERKPDTAGQTYWLDSMRAGVSRAEVLLAFAASPENKALTLAATEKGILFAEPGVVYIPVSNATSPTHSLVGTTVHVDGSTSTDANGDKLHYEWTVVTKPFGSNAMLTDFSAIKPSITLDKPGTYELSLRTSDASAPSYSPANVTIVANSLVADSGKFTCSNLGSDAARSLYMAGHTYLDRDRDGRPCEASDLSYERLPPVPAIVDSGTYTCSSITRETAMLMYLQGHTYLDRDKDGKPCEANDITLEKPAYTPPVITPPSSGRCWVNGYRRKNGTYVSGYYRRC